MLKSGSASGVNSCLKHRFVNIPEINTKPEQVINCTGIVFYQTVSDSEKQSILAKFSYNIPLRSGFLFEKSAFGKNILLDFKRRQTNVMISGCPENPDSGLFSPVSENPDLTFKYNFRFNKPDDYIQHLVIKPV